LAAALSAGSARVTVVTPGRAGRDGSTAMAQGGVAVALGADDSPGLHAEDTLAAAAGLATAEAVRRLVEAGPGAIRHLIELGARFDRGADGAPALGREAAHSRSRILHAGGDATGAEIARALGAAAAAAEWVTVEEGAAVRHLARAQGRVVGAVLEQDGARVLHLARAVVLATGGLGSLYRHTTNPSWARGEGLALAARAGALLADLEFVQFHPTALAAALAGERGQGGHATPGAGVAFGDRAASGAPLPLLTEALRGAGAAIVDEAGRRFLFDVDPRGELAPRDVVALAIWRRLRAGGRAFLDAREAVGDRLPELFPTVFAACRERGLDPRVDPLPVTPAAHYQMGGVVVDERGRTTVPGLWAAGEVARTGAHGANRLASNSLLEGLVWGLAAGRDAAARAGELPVPKLAVDEIAAPAAGSTAPEDPQVLASVRAILWERVGLERDGRSLARALAELAALESTLLREDRVGRDQLLVARMVTTAALARTESRGAHRRADFPVADPTWRDHVLHSLEPDGRSIRWRRSAEARLDRSPHRLAARSAKTGRGGLVDLLPDITAVGATQEAGP
jgi:L-aspartate oxidase